MRGQIPAYILMLMLLYCAALQQHFYNEKLYLGHLQRYRRQLDLTLTADHDNRQQSTDISLEALANLWRSADSKTSLDGGIKLVHTKNSFQTDSTKYKARLDLKFELGN
uniref:DNA-directed RNA polymerase subunit beta n=1 Tax=Zeugodacus cucurbitae TaxID=28588 RepID=A0A0A1XEW5_ZEUCU